MSSSPAIWCHTTLAHPTEYRIRGRRLARALWVNLDRAD